MKLAKGPSLWIAERRGRVVYTRAGRARAPGVPKARELKSEEAAQTLLEAERDKRLADGYVMVDDAAGLDAPFTTDGKPRTRVVPSRYARVAETIRMHVRGGFKSREDLDTIIDDLARGETGAARAEKLTRSLAALPMEQRLREMEVQERWAKQQREQAAEDEDGGAGAGGLRDLLGWVANDERAALRARTAPSPCVNDAIDAAFDELDRGGIIALQAAGFTQSDGWSDAHDEQRRRTAAGRPARGACFYHEQDLARGVRGEGLMLAVGAFVSSVEDEDEATILVGREVAQALRKHGVAVEWDEDPKRRIRILPFEWFRRPPS